MPLNVSPKAGSVNSNTPSATITRQSVSLRPPPVSTARAEALKARLRAPAAPPVAPRPPGKTSARSQAEMAKLQNIPQPTQPPRLTTPKDLSSIEPPPSGLVSPPSGQVPLSETAESPAAGATSAPLSPQFVALAREE